MIILERRVDLDLETLREVGYITHYIRQRRSEVLNGKICWGFTGKGMKHGILGFHLPTEMVRLYFSPVKPSCIVVLGAMVVGTVGWRS